MSLSTESSDKVRELASASGKYELISQYTDGMNGYAFRAKHIPKGIEVFIKICDVDTESSEVFQEAKFLVTATADGDADHLVVLHDAEMLGEEYILMAMELVNGGNLSSKVIDNSIGQADAVNYAMDVLRGVGKLHKNQLLHRDLKPANILLSVNGEKSSAKVGDFGSVKRLTTSGGTVNSSRHSPIYVPPEGWTVPNAYGTRSDLYQVGIVLHEMVNGPLPYQLASHLDNAGIKKLHSQGYENLNEMDDCDACLLVNECIARRTMSQKLLALSPTQPYQSKRLTKIIKKATSPDVDDRYGSAVEFRGALQALHLPNWKRVGAGFEAIGWQGKDWLVSQVQKSGTLQYQISKRLVGGTYRKFGDPYPEAKDAFQTVEDQSE
ncbi:serine/threonine protein kinase [Tunturibacter empetritectus]|uniref:Serine/threonine protein kinase n=1 Tax=Tunturiibacter lichenicola TaxID=2051959 RepID=A0A7W8N618_9BACT|nr:protein kinase [Edaphobacter lichenicola]MBB5344585.1 serine/threonine protein kinase [Edaphobacter lichenicola]